MRESMSMIVAFAKAAEADDIGEICWTDDQPRRATLVSIETDPTEPLAAWATYESGGERFIVKLLTHYVLSLCSPGGKMIDG